MSHEPAEYTGSILAFYATLGALAGLINKLQRWTGGDPPHCWKCAVARLIVELITSGFIGLLTLFVCDELNFSRNWTAVNVAAMGHMGCRAMFILERMVMQRLRKIGNIDLSDDGDNHEER